MKTRIVTLLLIAETLALSAQKKNAEKDALYYIKEAYSYRNKADKAHTIKYLKLFESHLSGNLKPESVSDSISYYYANTVAFLMSYLGNLERENPGESINWETVYTYQIKQAERGNANAQANVENLYYYKKDYIKAAKWYRKAAERGDANSQFFLGRMYRQGNGITKDNVEAAKWYLQNRDMHLPKRIWAFCIVRAMVLHKIKRKHYAGIANLQNRENLWGKII